MAKKRVTTTTPALRLRETENPILYEVNTRVFLRELSVQQGSLVTLATIPDEILDEWAEHGFEAVWFMGVWTTGELGAEIARSYPGLQEEYHRALPDFRPEDVLGSPYAVSAYRVSPMLGGNTALKTLRTRLAERGIGVILDFVCNHTARDHKWVTEDPDLYIQGNEGEDRDRPDFFFKVKTRKGERVLAFGRDPTFPGWTDTAQLNHANEPTRAALIKELRTISRMCDGVRCDMAMLMLSDIFSRTWRERAKPVGGEPPVGEFWKEAIDAIRAEKPEFIFIAEAYWNREWDLQQLGFNYTYDKILYDRLLREGASAVRDHLKADVGYQKRCLRFIENHDEPRAARMLPSEPWMFAAATVVATVPGMTLIHDGQMEGRLLRLPVQLIRRSAETHNQNSRNFYRRLLAIVHHPVFEKGSWRVLDARPAWHDNITYQNFLVFWYHHPVHGVRLVVVNYAPHSGQCYVDIPFDEVEWSSLDFRDLMGQAVYVRDRAGIQARGMYFDLPGYGLHIFEVSESQKSGRA